MTRTPAPGTTASSAPAALGCRRGSRFRPPGTYTGPGWSIEIHGYGYFFPWGLADLRERATGSPVLSRLRSAVEEWFGGRFVFPAADVELLQPRLIDGAGEWMWLASEDV